jgi:hypothetical protein
LVAPSGTTSDVIEDTCFDCAPVLSAVYLADHIKQPIGATTMINAPEGAKEAVQELVTSIALVTDNWAESTAGKSAAFKKAATLSALTNALVMLSMYYQVPAEVVLQSVAATLDVNGAFDDDDDTVH